MEKQVSEKGIEEEFDKLMNFSRNL